jgi:hypothetical protein
MATGLFCDIAKWLACPLAWAFAAKTVNIWDEVILREKVRPRDAVGPQTSNSAQKSVQGSLSG